MGASIGALVVGTPAWATDGYFLSGVGAKAKGEAGVAIALPQDALSIAANPAAATELGHRLDGGVEIFVPDRGARIRGNQAGPDADFSGNGANPFVLPEIAYVRPLSDRVSVGIAINGNGGMNTSYDRNPFARFGATGKAGVNLQQILISPTIAVRLGQGHSVGLSPVAVVQGFRASGLAPFARASADPANFTDKGTSWSAGGGVRLGYLGHIGPALTIGAFYQSKLQTGRFRKYAGLFEGRGSFDVPASWGGGVALRVTPALTLASDVKRIEYSGVTSIGNPLSRLRQGNPFGADNGPGFGWRDITVVKVGVSYAVDPSWAVRAGYGRSGNPVPASQTFLNILAPGVVQDHFTVGATWTTPSGLEVTGFALHAPKNLVRGEASIPTSFGGGEADVFLAQTSVGIGLGKRF